MTTSVLLIIGYPLALAVLSRLRCVVAERRVWWFAALEAATVSIRAGWAAFLALDYPVGEFVSSKRHRGLEAELNPGSSPRTLVVNFDVLFSSGLGKNRGGVEIALPSTGTTNPMASSHSVVAEPGAVPDLRGRHQLDARGEPYPHSFAEA